MDIHKTEEEVIQLLGQRGVNVHALTSISAIESALPMIEDITRQSVGIVRFYLLYYIEYQCQRLYHLMTKQPTHPPFHYGQLPDVIHCIHLCTLFDDSRPPGIPILHIISKALPQRCQYRNLKEICIDYCKKHVSIMEWLKRCILCSLGGYYPHCTYVIPFWLRITLYEGLRNTTTTGWCKWIQQNGYLLFYIIKEFIIFAVQYEPALYESICSTYYWKEFEETCKMAMKKVRTIMVLNIKHQEGNIFEHIEVDLLKYNAFQLHYLYKIPKMDTNKNLYELMRYIRQLKYQKWVEQGTIEHLKERIVCDKDTNDMIQTIVRHGHLLPHVPSSTWLRLCGLSPQGCAQWDRIKKQYLLEDVSKKQTAHNIHAQISLADFTIINNYICKRFELQSIHVVRLPKHWYVNQYHALQIREESGTYYICKACKTFKAFLVRPSVSDVHFYAQGHDKIMYDDTTGKKYCGRRIVKGQMTRKKTKKCKNALYQTKQSKINRTARGIRRGDESMECINTELIPVSLLGHLIQCYGKLYVLCPMPNCGRPCRFDFHKTSFAGTFSCGRCHMVELDHERSVCGYCGEMRKDTTTNKSPTCSLNEYIIQAEGIMKKIYLCGKHNMMQFKKGLWTKEDMWTAIQKRQQRNLG